MKRNINYEWDIEEHAVDSNGECLDVLDHYHSKKCPSLYQLNQLDKIYHSGIDAWKADIKAVKDAHAKSTFDQAECDKRKKAARDSVS